jgi:ADP-ribose pyrophosphatase YjhB (NUDIX family)
MKYNLIFEGIPQEIGENTEAAVKKTVKEKLEIDDDITFQNVHRLGKQPNRDKPRGIIARFYRYEDYERVRNAVTDKLKGTTYSVYQQYLKEIAGRRRDLVPKYGIFGLKRFSNWRYDWCIVATKQQASKLPVCQHLSTDRVYHYYHGFSSRFLPMAGSRSKGIFTT